MNIVRLNWLRGKQMSLKKFEDSDILLRKIEQEDAIVLMNLNNNPEIMKCVVGNPKVVTMEQQKKWMEKIKDEKNVYRLMICCQNVAVGTIIISNIDEGTKLANLNIKIDKEYWGKGIGFHAIKKALNICFVDFGLHCVTAHILTENLASLALFKKCGFKEEGVLRARVFKDEEYKDLVSLSILSFEYLVNNYDKETV